MDEPQSVSTAFSYEGWVWVCAYCTRSFSTETISHRLTLSNSNWLSLFAFVFSCLLFHFVILICLSVPPLSFFSILLQRVFSSRSISGTPTMWMMIMFGSLGGRIMCNNRSVIKSNQIVSHERCIPPPQIRTFHRKPTAYEDIRCWYERVFVR